MSNGKCGQQPGGCTEFQLFKQEIMDRLGPLEDTVKTIKHMFWAIVILLIANLVGVATAIALK